MNNMRPAAGPWRKDEAPTTSRGPYDHRHPLPPAIDCHATALWRTLIRCAAVYGLLATSHSGSPTGR